MTKTERIASLFKQLTYDEMTAIAEWFSTWTGIDEDGNEKERAIDAAMMAANLSDWAGNVLDEAE